MITHEASKWRSVVTFVRRRLPLIGYLILAGFVIYAFSVERSHSNQNRRELANQTRTVLIQNCERQNQLRGTLREIVRQSIPQIEQYVKDGTLTRKQADTAIAQTKHTVSVLSNTDCVRAYPVPKPESG